MATWASIVEQDLNTERGSLALVFGGRIYVRNTAPYFQIRTQEWAEYYVCANGCDGCKARVIRRSPIDGRLPYVRRSTDVRTESHDADCKPDRRAIVVRKAKQQLYEVVASTTVNGPYRNIRSAFNSISNSLLHNSGLRTAVALPQLAQLVRTAQRKRRKRFGVIPQTMSMLLEVPYHLTKTTFGDNDFLLFFFYFDYRDTQGRRRQTKVLAYATERDLARLFRARRVFVDGTFKVRIYTKNNICLSLILCIFFT
jgi:hypothetical protein